MPDSEQPWRDEETLRTLHHGEGLSTYELAERFGCSRTTVSNWLGRFDIPVRGKQPEPCALEDESLTREMYSDRDLSMSEVAEEVGCTVWKVRYWLNQHDIEPRAKGGRFFATSELTDEDWLRERYVEQGMTVTEIADQLDCSSRTVTEWLHKHDIGCSWALPEAVRSQLNNEERLRELYEEEGLTSVDIAERFGCSHSYVADKLREFKITDYSMAGEDHPRWNGGDYSYGNGWSEGKREAVRERDDYQCRRCGMENEEHHDRFETVLHVHHIRKARNVEDDETRNSMENLITLCALCHSEVEEMTPELPDEIDV